jgi:hypothetical protein
VSSVRKGCIAAAHSCTAASSAAAHGVYTIHTLPHSTLTVCQRGCKSHLQLRSRATTWWAVHMTHSSTPTGRMCTTSNSSTRHAVERERERETEKTMCFTHSLEICSCLQQCQPGACCCLVLLLLLLSSRDVTCAASVCVCCLCKGCLDSSQLH